MQKQTKTTVISLTFSALIIFLLGSYVYKDFFLKEDSEDIVSLETESANEIVDGSQLEFEYIDDVASLSVPIPDLDRGFVFDESIPSELRLRSISSLEEIINRLKNKPGSFNDWLDLASNRKLIGDFEGAVEAWEYASLLDPSNAIPLSNIGNLYHYYTKDYKKAEEYFLKALERDPKMIFIYTNLHELYKYSYKQETNKAADILIKGLEVNQDDISLLVNLANYYKEKSDSKNATIYYEKASEQAILINDMNLYFELQKEISLFGL